MASIIMHMCISEMVRDKLNLNADFLLGSIMPDLKKMLKVDRSESHCMYGPLDSNIDVDGYIKENIYKLKNKDGYTLGYLSHLIQDKIWFTNYLVTDDMTREDYYNKVYSFFPLADRYIIKYDNINLEKLKKNILGLSLDSNITNLVQEVKLYDIINENILLDLTYEDVIDYQKKCIEEVVNVLTSF